MNLLSVIWPMVAGACLMLGLIQFFLWLHQRYDRTYLLAILMAFGAVAVSLLEMHLFSSLDVYQHERILLWLNPAIALVLIPMVWLILTYLPTARRWVAILISLLWAIGIAINFLLPGNLTFSEVTGIGRYVTAWGEAYYVPIAVISDWKWLADITVPLILGYILDAVWRARKNDLTKDAWIIAASTVLYVLIAGVQAILVDQGIYRAPYMISPPFLLVILAFTWVFAKAAVRAEVLDVEVLEARRETEHLMRANLLGEMAATLAHELNQPLAAILGNAQATQKFLDQPETDMDEIREILVDIVRDDKRARDIITNLRRMLRGDDAEDERVILKQATREILDFMRDDLKVRSIAVDFTAEQDIPHVSGGRVAIQQVIMNLVLNSAQAIDDSNASRRDIQISLVKKQSGAEIIVRDFGPGLPEKIRKRLFEPFVTTKKKSLGMGLAVCHRIVENQGGRMTGENPEDGGARFRVWLPEYQS